LGGFVLVNRNMGEQESDLQNEYKLCLVVMRGRYEGKWKMK